MASTYIPGAYTPQKLPEAPAPITTPASLPTPSAPTTDRSNLLSYAQDKLGSTFTTSGKTVLPAPPAPAPVNKLASADQQIEGVNNVLTGANPMGLATTGQKVAPAKEVPNTAKPAAPAANTTTTLPAPPKQDKGAEVKQTQNQKALDDLQLRQQSMRQQTVQDLYEAGQRGAGLSALMALNNRDLSSQFSDLEFNLAQDMGEYLANKIDEKESAAQASHMATFSSMMATDPVAAMAFADTMAIASPDEPYWQTMANPKIREALLKASDPIMKANRDKAIEGVVKDLEVAGYNYLDPKQFEDAVDYTVGELRNALDEGFITASTETWFSSAAGKAEYERLQQEILDETGINAEPTEKMKQDAWLQHFAESRLKSKVKEDVKMQVANGLLEIKDLSPESKKMMEENLSTLATSDGWLNIMGTVISADSLESAGLDIFEESWFPANPDFADLTPEQKKMNDKLDKVWLEAVKEAGGAIGLSRGAFAQAAFLNGLDTLTPQQVLGKMKASGVDLSEDYGQAGSPSSWSKIIPTSKPAGGFNSADLLDQYSAIKGDEEAMADASSRWVRAASNNVIEILDPGTLGGSLDKESTWFGLGADKYSIDKKPSDNKAAGWYLFNKGDSAGYMPAQLTWGNVRGEGSSQVQEYTLTYADGTVFNGEAMFSVNPSSGYFG